MAVSADTSRSPRMISVIRLAGTLALPSARAHAERHQVFLAQHFTGMRL
jgi:hypothetical protein